MSLSKGEQQLMEHLWTMEKAFMKDLIDAYDDPKPAPSTVATLLKRMADKGFVRYTVYGNSRQYYPLVKKNDYFSKQFKSVVKSSFDGSAFQLASFFTKTANLSEEELKQLRKIIDEQIQKKKK